MKILITGAAGFIGFSLAKKFLENKKYKIYGIDNFDNYYSVKLKKKRVGILKKNKNFFFNKIDINSNKIINYCKNKKFDIVFHFAAQAGVRYSLVNPQKYINTNIYGFMRLMNSLNRSKLKKIIYASSSSVYGDTKIFPTKENAPLKPKNIYGYSKLINENLANFYFKKFNIPFIGLRLFTIYGVWGRPDMLILKILKINDENKYFKLNNSGNHYRDFTSINDVIDISNKLILSKKINKNLILNICSSKPIFIKNLIKKIKFLKNDIRIKNIKKNTADVYKTHGSNVLLEKYLNYKINRNFDEELEKLVKWFDDIKKYKYF